MSSKTGEHTVTAEMVANVLRVDVSVGDSIAVNDPICILESMKMEIPVLAKVAGRVAEVPIAAGDVVRDGDQLAVIAPNP